MVKKMKALLLPTKVNQEYLIKYFPAEYNKCLDYFYAAETINETGVSQHLYVINECADLTFNVPYYDDDARKNLQREKIITLVPFKLDKCTKMIFNKEKEVDKNCLGSYSFQTEYNGSLSAINMAIIDNFIQIKWGELKCLITDQ